MHMKIRLRFLSVLLPLVLIATPLYAAYAAVPKAGAKCSKAKSTATYAGKKFTCVKSGTKLAWNKGVKILVPKPVATPSTSASATPKVSGTPTPSTSATPKISATPTLTSYTMQQVATNNKASSCWTVINGSVYDLTRWIDIHPGGPEVITSMCGIDSTAVFTAQHDDAANPVKILKQFILGPIKK